MSYVLFLTKLATFCIKELQQNKQYEFKWGLHLTTIFLLATIDRFAPFKKLLFLMKFIFFVQIYSLSDSFLKKLLGVLEGKSCTIESNTSISKHPSQTKIRKLKISTLRPSSLRPLIISFQYFFRWRNCKGAIKFAYREKYTKSPSWKVQNYEYLKAHVYRYFSTHLWVSLDLKWFLSTMIYFIATVPCYRIKTTKPKCQSLAFM